MPRHIFLAAAAAWSATALVMPRTARISSIRMAAFEPGVTKTDERVTVVGASGYIGKAVVRECVRRGYATTAVVRDASKASFDGATTVGAECADLGGISRAFEAAGTDVVVCCLASRSGTEADSLLVDYEASVNCLEAARKCGARHYVLLSAFCVAKPDLSFQTAKLKTEAALAGQGDVSYSVVRPTAFFKSLSGQVEILKGGGPFVYFDLGGDRSATCNPISEADLAMAIVDCVADPARSSKGGEPIWNVGGPDAGISMKDQGELIATAIAEVDGEPRKEPWLLGVPIGVFDGIVGAIKWAYDLTGSPKVKDAWELGQIGRYYAVEDMLTTAPAEKYGKMSLKEHYKQVAKDGQEYDPYTTIFAKAPTAAMKAAAPAAERTADAPDADAVGVGTPLFGKKK
jgi:divinyl chlorophyllide a 8-vinyl-reductase